MRRAIWASTRAAGLVTCMAVSSCGEERPPPAPASSASLPAGGDRVDREPSSAPRPVVIGVRAFPTTLDPVEALDPWGQRVVDDLVFQGLTRRDQGAAPFAAPAAADICEVGSDGSQQWVDCHLRPGLTFHDESPVTMEDVLYSLRWWLDPRRETARLRHGLGSLAGASLTSAPPNRPDRADDRWVRVHFSRPEPLALEILAAMKIVPLRAHSGNRRGFGRAPIGTGPMKVTEFVADHLTLDPVEGDARGSVVIMALPDGALALTMLRRGEVHVVDEVAPVHLPDELTRPGMDPRFRAYLTSPPRYDLLLHNLARKVHEEPGVRRALQAALPLSAVERVAGMPSRSASAPVDLHDPEPIDLAVLERAGASATWGLGGLPARRPDVDVAAEVNAGIMLDGHDWPLIRGVRRRASGSVLRLVLLWSGERGYSAEVAGLVRGAWRRLGVDVRNATASWAYGFGLIRKGEFDVALTRLGTHSDEDLSPYFHSQGVANFAGVRDPSLDAALGAYRSATTRADRSNAKRAVAERLSDLGATAMLYAPTSVLLVSKHLREPTFVDDLPRLDLLTFVEGEPDWLLGVP